MNIIKRDILSVISSNLDKEEAILVIGPRQVGKTTMLHQIEKEVKKHNDSYFLNLEDPEYLSLLNKSPKNLFDIFPINLNKKTYVFIDEVQYLENPSNFIKYIVDEYKGRIKLIVSGSSSFYLDKKFKDSLVGRKILLTMLPLSFKEFFFFKNKEEINNSLSSKEKIRHSYLEYLIFGGYPKVILAETREEKIEVLRDLAYSYIKKDIFESGIKQDEVFYKLLKILSSQIGELVNNSELANTLDVSKTSINDYISIMQKSFHLILISPFFKNIRKETTKMPKVYFLDNGLRNFFVNNFKSYIEREDNGQLLENGFLRELLNKYNRDEIRFWRTADNKEIDFVVNDELAIEVKSQTKNIKKDSVRLFLENYPEINFKIGSLQDIESAENFPVIKPWEIK